MVVLLALVRWRYQRTSITDAALRLEVRAPNCFERLHFVVIKRYAFGEARVTILYRSAFEWDI